MGGRSKLPFVVGGVVALAGAGVAIFLVTRSSGSDLTLGPRSRDELVKQTFHAIGEGDAASLMKRSGQPGMRKLITCDKENTATPEQDQKELDELTEELTRAATRGRGASYTVGAITVDGEPEVMKKGDKMGKGCTLNVPLKSWKLSVPLEIKHQDGTSETQTATMTAIEVAGQWISPKAPTITGCNTAIARLALTTGREIKEASTINGLQPIFMKRCRRDAWSSDLQACVSKALTVVETSACLAKLPADALDTLRKEVEAAIAGAPSVAARVRQILPDEAPEEPPPTAVAAGDAIDETLVPDEAPDDPVEPTDRGTPEPAEIGDFWLWTRSDGAVRVTSPMVEILFPQRPTVVLEKGSKTTADGKTFWLYKFRHDIGGDNMLSLEVGALGRNASVVSGEDPLVKMFQKLGPVKRRKRELGGVTFTDLEVTDPSTGGSLRALAIRNMPRGVFMVAMALTSKDNRLVGTKFLTSLVPLEPADPTTDPELLADVAVKKAGKTFVAHTANEDFSIELPAKPTIERTGPSAGKNHVAVAITADNKGAKVSVQLTEFASWDALTNTPDKQAALAEEMKAYLEKQNGQPMQLGPTTIAGLPAHKVDPVGKAKAKVQARLVWNRFQHRSVLILCSDAPCDQIVGTLTFAAPTPVAAPPPEPPAE